MSQHAAPLASLAQPASKTPLIAAVIVVIVIVIIVIMASSGSSTAPTAKAATPAASQPAPVAAAAAPAAAVAPSAPAGRTYYKVSSWDYPGGEVDGTYHTGLNPTSCQALCDSTNGCIAATWGLDNQNCWLKGSLPQGGASSVRDTYVLANSSKWSAHDNTDFPQNDIGGAPYTTKVADQNVCRSIGAYAPNAAGVAYNKTNGDCWVKNQVQNIAPSTGVYSWY